MEQIKYINIQYFIPRFVDCIDPGDHIVIQEKIDGANFSIRYDEVADEVVAFSSKMQLDSTYPLRGALEWSQSLNKDIIKKYLGSNLILFGEWLVPHTIVYPEEAYKKAYFYDVYDTTTDRFYPQDMVKEIVNDMGLIYVPTFYSGRFISWEHISTFIGRTELGGAQGEGIVVKNITRLNSTDLRHPYYIKIVNSDFAEVRGMKEMNLDKLNQEDAKTQEVHSIVTTARVRKLIHKMVDDGVIPEDWDERNFREIVKNIGTAVYRDCLKEEPETVKRVGKDFGRIAHKVATRIIRNEILN